MSPDAFTNPKLCPMDVPGPARRLLQQGPDPPSPFSLDLFMKAAGAWIGASIGGETQHHERPAATRHHQAPRRGQCRAGV